MENTTKCGMCGTAIPGRLYPHLCERCWDAEQDYRHRYDDERDGDRRLNESREAEV